MKESQDASTLVAENSAKEIGRLFGELAKQNSKEFPDGGVVLAISSQLIAHHGLLSTILSGKMASHMDKLVQQSDKLTAQTDTLIQLTRSAEVYTRRIVILTWFLAILTFALLAAEVRTMIFPKNRNLEIQSNQAAQNNDVVRPNIPKSQNP